MSSLHDNSSFGRQRMSPYVRVEGLKRWWSWASNLNYRHSALSWGRRLHQAITLSGMQTSGIAVDRRRRTLKSDRRHVKRALVFRLRSKLLPSCPGQERSERKPYYWMPVLKVHSLPTPKGTGYHKLHASSPSQSFHSHNFLRNFLKMCLSTWRILRLLLHLTKYLIFLS